MEARALTIGNAGRAIAQEDLAQERSLTLDSTFDTFVIGNANNVAHAAALAVAQSPGKVYNPLFVYGRVGLGKTHLLKAIGHRVMTHETGASVAYLSSEQFTNEFVDCLQQDQLCGFRQKYQQIDVLLLDDIQFLAGKDSSRRHSFISSTCCTRLASRS